ncbi:hypothetical protein [Dyella japonica]|uniref:Nucleotidyltransferase family protein n=1 Tax=Dyella japonica A8 TaxID=1217721 RepID=A0A075K627_9GAMM|nr:hypothetical protein [Dyella japonica]AIF47633.1 hypothetical protein HY57_10335 [Dyella japonica A8]
MSHVTPALYTTLAEIVPELHVQCLDPWCLIGSAAALLAGADVGVADVDVLTSREDAERLMASWSERREHVYEPAGAERFRSHFARFRFPGMPVEVMGGLELNRGDGWKPVQAGRLTLVGLNGLAVPVPSIEDQIRILESFGREKDHQRATLLRKLSGSPLRIVP